jgi:hypothetical protein
MLQSIIVVIVSQPLKNVATIFSSQAIEKQEMARRS